MTVASTPLGRVLSGMDANSHASTSLYNGRADLLSTQNPLAAFTSYGYDAVANKILRTDARQWPTTFTLDALNRTVGQVYIDGTRVTNTFDAAGQQLTQQDLLGIRSFGYDLAGRKTSVAYPTGLNLTMAFDPVSNRVSLLDTDNGYTSWSFDSQNRIAGIVNPLAEMTTIQWDALDREQKRTLANGMAVSHTYDAAGRETLLENRDAFGVALAVFTNSYNPVSNRLTVLELDGTRVTFGYDPISQLTNEQRSGANAYNTTYVYDPAQNRTSKNVTGQVTNSSYNAANQLTLSTPPSGAPTTSSWDANGNLALENTGGTLGTYLWDPENRLLSAPGITGTESYAYSADGLRQSKVNSAGTTQFVWDDQNLFQERDANLVKVAQYTNFPGFWGGLASQRRGSTSSFLGFDSQGSTRILVSIGGVITDNYSYTAFGEHLEGGSGTINPHRYIGQYGYYEDLPIRLYVDMREADPRNGRWLSVDLVRGELPYAYADNSPISRADPTGLASWITIGYVWWFFGKYDHAYILFNNGFKCNGASSFGFWPNTGGNVKCAGAGLGLPSGILGSSIFNFELRLFAGSSGKKASGPGFIEYPDSEANEDRYTHLFPGTVNDTDESPGFNEALCACIQRSIKHPPQYCIGRFVCGSWVDGMWECAHNAQKKSKTRAR